MPIAVVSPTSKAGVFQPARPEETLKSDDDARSDDTTDAPAGWADPQKPRPPDSEAMPVPPRPTLTLADLPRRVLDCHYAVRGPTVALAQELAAVLAQPQHNLPFEKLIYVNIGDPQSLGQRPISFFREVLSCVMYPPLMGLPLHFNAVKTAAPPSQLQRRVEQQRAEEEGAVQQHFNSDVVQRAQQYLQVLRSAGAYTHSQGAPLIRQKVAAWFAERDGHPTTPDQVFLTDGASAGVARLLEVLHRSPADGMLVPVPQYPLYAGLLTRIGSHTVGYYLDEDRGWAVDVAEVERALREARASGICVRGIVVINPGNPTGQVLARDRIEELVMLCHREGLVIIADEVYQENVYGDVPFVSMRKVALGLGASVSVFSLHSTSKGLVGECGLRGGCFVADNVPSDVLAQLYKLASMSLCAGVMGQLMLANLCSPPRPSEPSYEAYRAEKEALYEAICGKAQMVYDELNRVPGISCQKINGSVFCFPRIELPIRAQQRAQSEGMQPDLFFCMELLRATGIVSVAGSGFGQRKGTWHVRICILPETALLREMLGKFTDFYTAFAKAYSSP